MAHATQAAREAAGRGEVVVAMGGDGLVGTLAGALRGSAPLGVLPAGRGNDFARELGIPDDIAGATRVLLDGVRRPSTSARRTAGRSPASPPWASTPRRTGSPTRRAREGQPGLRLRGASAP